MRGDGQSVRESRGSDHQVERADHLASACKFDANPSVHARDDHVEGKNLGVRKDAFDEGFPSRFSSSICRVNALEKLGSGDRRDHERLVDEPFDGDHATFNCDDDARVD